MQQQSKPAAATGNFDEAALAAAIAAWMGGGSWTLPTADEKSVDGMEGAGAAMVKAPDDVGEGTAL